MESPWNDDDIELESVVSLEQSLSKWERVLHFVVNRGSIGSAHEPPQGTAELLQTSGLICRPDRHPSDVRWLITNKGFSFLLHDVHHQIWQYLTAWLRAAESRGQDEGELLRLLTGLQALDPGVGRSGHVLSPTQQNALDLLEALGLVWRPEGTDAERPFFATPLTRALGTTGIVAEESSFGEFIVVETNFKLYAYTTSPLQIALLSLFVTMEYRLPNLVVGSITRESVSRALQDGIESEQMIAFLRQNAHQKARQREYWVPLNVCEQIKLWQGERNRMSCQPAVLLEGFPHDGSLFSTTMELAQQRGVFLLQGGSGAGRWMIVDKAGEDIVKEFSI